MSKLGRREYFLFKISDANLESLIDMVKSAMDLPSEYSISIYPGKYNLNVVTEISGPDEEK